MTKLRYDTRQAGNEKQSLLALYGHFLYWILCPVSGLGYEEIVDTEEIKSNASEVIPEEPLAVQSPKRRVIRSENLVGHERREKQAVEPQLNRSWENKTIFGQPQDPNMKNGMLAMEINLENQPIKTYTK